MKIRNYEAVELLLMTLVSLAATVWAIVIDHPRYEFMILMTALLALMAVFASFRHRRQVQTLHATGRRKKNVAKAFEHNYYFGCFTRNNRKHCFT